jgi:ribosomal protein S18 acetylase RimI-like enzyme
MRVILDLIAKTRPAKHINDYPVKVDIEENLASAVVRSNTRLWFENGQPVAWSYVDLFNNLRWEVENQLTETIGTEIMEWGETCIRNTLTENQSATLDASCRDDYSARISFLIKHGFSQTQDTTVHLVRSLCEPIPDPVLPAGFIIRPIQGREEAEAVAASHRAAFGTEHMTTESRLVIMNTSDYDSSLDLVVIAPDGTVAGNCICSVNEKQKKGFTDPISIHPAFRSMGLARSLLLTGMRMLKERGMESAHLGTSGYNTAMQKTAESVGFKVEYRTIWFSKEIHLYGI